MGTTAVPTTRLEDEAITIIREVAAECERPVLLFSGGKDSVVMLHLAQRAFFPARIPFPVMHVDTGHNFEEVIEFRDRTVKQFEVDLIVASVRGVDRPGAVCATSPASARRGTCCRRSPCSTPSSSIASTPCSAAPAATRSGRGRRSGSCRTATSSDSGIRRTSAPSCGGCTTPTTTEASTCGCSHCRTGPSSTCGGSSPSVNVELPALYFAHEREVFRRDGMLMAVNDHVARRPSEAPFSASVRFRTIGDAHVHRGGRIDGGDGGRHRRRDRRRPASPSVAATRCRRPHLRSRHGRPQTPGLFLMVSPSQPEVARRADGALARRCISRTVGSVDDGKSTLIGRLLHDSKSIFEDQLEHIESVSRRRGHDDVDLALLTDGLRAEREQGITIDVAYRYFSTPHRDFVIADCPGHLQYTRNMVTGVSRADLAVLLVDARLGIVEQTRRHTLLTALLRVPHVVIAVNKMDLVDYAEARFDEIRDEFVRLAAGLDVDLEAVTFVPISALAGDNVVERSNRMPWYGGPTLLHHLETVVIDSPGAVAARLPVQYVIRPQRAEHRDYRGFAGTVAAGTLRVGDAVVVLPSGIVTTIAAIDTPDGPVDEAAQGRAVTVVLADDVDVSRGDVIVDAADAPGPRSA